MFIFRIFGAVMLFLVFVSQASATKFEFAAGLAYNHPAEKPVPALTDGYGFNFSGCLWIKNRIGLAIGAMGTRHKLDGGTRLPNQTITITSNEGLAYIEGRYKLLVSKRWEIAPILGASVYNSIDGGDGSGSYLQYENYPNYAPDDIGYTGSGYWAGVSIYRAIYAYQRGYYIYLNMYYNFLAYSKQQFYRELTDETSGFTYLVLLESKTNRRANMLIVSLGIVFRFDFSSI